MDTPAPPDQLPVSGPPLRVLIVTDTAILGLGGGEGFLRRLVQSLPADRYRFDVLQLAPEPSGDWLMAAPPVGNVRLRYLPVRAVYGRGGLAALRYLRRLVRDGDYDVVQSQHEKSDLISALLPNGGSFRRISNRRDMGFHKSRKLRWIMRWLNRRFDRIVAPSAAILDVLVREDGVDPDHCLCIPNGVDTQRYAPLEPAQRATLRSQFGFAGDELVVGCAARLWDVKRHQDLVRGFARAHQHEPRARLVLVGSGPERPAIERLVAELGLGDVVSLLGARTDLDRILPAFDIFALTSSSEGLSNAILEAQSCALPVLATNVGGNPELVDERCGVLVPPFDPAAIADALAALFADPDRRAQMGAMGRARVEKEHSLAAMMDAYDALYHELCHVG